MLPDATVRELEGAIRANALFLEYQHIVALENKRTAKLEARLRWAHPRLGLLTADRFLHLASGSELARHIDHWVIRTVCRQLAEWQGRYTNHVPVAVSVTADSLMAPGLLTIVQDALQGFHVPANLLEIDITEHARITDLQHARKVIQSLRTRGVLIGIDDFGSGYASLTYASELAPDCLTIDRSFIAQATHGSATHIAIVNLIVGLGRKLGMRVTAEGIENEEQFRFARSTGCDYGQGYFFGQSLRESA